MHDKLFNIGKTLKYHGCQRGLASIVYKYFDKKASGCATLVAIKSTVKT